MVAFFALAASFVFALPSVLAEPVELYARQAPTGFDPSVIPTSCQSQCQAALTTISSGTCTTLDCLCTDANANAMKSCLECAVGANVPNFNQTVADDAIQSFSQSCSAAGHPVSVTAGGSGSSGSSASAAGSSSSSKASSTGGSSSPTTTATTPNNAIAGHPISIVGSVFAIALASVVFV